MLQEWKTRHTLLWELVLILLAVGLFAYFASLKYYSYFFQTIVLLACSFHFLRKNNVIALLIPVIVPALLVFVMYLSYIFDPGIPEPPQGFYIPVEIAYLTIFVMFLPSVLATYVCIFLFCLFNPLLRRNGSSTSGIK